MSAFALLAFIASINPSPWVVPERFETLDACEVNRAEMAKLFPPPASMFWCVPAPEVGR